MKRNKIYLVDYQDFNGGHVAFGGSKDQITGKGKIKIGKLYFEDVYFVMNYNILILFVSQMRDKKNKVLFTDTECLVLFLDFKLPDENQVLLRVPRQNNMYSFNLKNIVPCGGLACLIAKATVDESKEWDRRLGHDETSGILKDFIRQIENQLNQKVKTIRCDNGIEFKNMDIIEFCRSKGIKREYSNARTPQQNGVTERKNRTLIEAARTMLADSVLPNTFWAEAVSTTCYVLNRVLVTKPQNKTPYELLTGKIPTISYIRPFGCHVTILNTIDHLGKFEEKSDEGFLVGYSLSSKAFRVYNLETKRVEENMHINFLENKPNLAGKGPTWLFDLDYLTDSMNYQPITVENKSNKTAGPKVANNSAATKDSFDAGYSKMEAEHAQEYYVLSLWSSYTLTVKSSKPKNRDAKLIEDTDSKTNKEPVDQVDQAFLEELDRLKRQEKEANDAVKTLRKTFAQSTKDLLLQAEVARASSTNYVNTASTPVNAASTPLNAASTPTNQDDSQIPSLEDIYEVSQNRIFTSAPYNDEGALADFTNLESTVNVSPIPQSRIHSIHPTTQILRDPNLVVQTRSKVNKSSGAHAFIEPKKISQALKDESWVDIIQEELMQFKTQQDERRVEVRNKARLVTQGHRQEEGIDYDEIFAPVARIEAIRILLAFASYMGFIVYQMDVKSTFLYGKIDEEVYVSQPPGFIDPKFPNKVYKVVKAMYGLHQAPRAWYVTLFTFLVQSGYRRGLIDKTLFIKKDKKDIMLVQVYVDDIIFDSTKKSWRDEFEALMKSRFHMSSMGKLTFFLGLQVKQKEDGIFISQDKYVAEILKKFDFISVKTASTPTKTNKPLVKDEEAADVDRIFRYLKGQPKLGLWYPRKSAFDLEAYSDSDYAGANLDRTSTTGEAEYVAAASGYGQLKVNAARPKLTTARVYAAEETVNDEVRIQALVDGKRVNIKESSIRRILRLDDAEAGSESRPPMLNKENYVPWSSRLSGDANREVNVTETFHLQIDDELSDKELKKIEVDDQAIQTILLGLPEDIYVAVDSCETTQEI
nr:hypothetical protein [Tanacetum cinerariifolium]